MEELKTARAQLVHARIAPRKVQIVCDMIRGKDTKVAEAYMANTPKAGCELMRGRPRAQGRMYRINKRTSHITIVVAEKA